MAPGLRLGWITSQPAFKAHLVRYIDLSTQHPSGFPQALVTLLLSGWGLAGFDRWVRSLRLDYQRRRDFLLELFEREVAPSGLASADVPEAGMFLWIRVFMEKHPRFRRVEAAEEDARKTGTETGIEPVPRTNGRQLMEELFQACLKGGLVIVPATVFLLPVDASYTPEGSEHIDDVSVRVLCYHIASSMSDRGLSRFAGCSARTFSGRRLRARRRRWRLGCLSWGGCLGSSSPILQLHRRRGQRRHEQALELRSLSHACHRANYGTRDGMSMSTPVNVRHSDRRL